MNKSIKGYYMQKIRTFLSGNTKIIGIIFVILSTFCFTVGQSFIKLSSEEINPIHLMFWRSFSGLLLLIIFSLIQGKIKLSFKEMNNKKIKWLFIRGLAGASAMFFYITALSLNDLGEVGSLSNLNPIFTVFIAYIILKERFNSKVWLAIAIALVGVFMIRNPFTQNFSISHIFILIATAMMSLGNVTNRKLKLMGVESWIIVASFLLFGSLIFFPKLLLDRPSYSLQSYAYIITAGILMTTGHYFLTSAARYIESKNISIIGLLSVFEFIFLGYFIFGEELTEIKFLGGVLIILSAIIVIRMGLMNNKLENSNYKG